MCKLLVCVVIYERIIFKIEVLINLTFLLQAKYALFAIALDFF